MKTHIEIIWSVDDIRSLNYECNDEQGMNVLESMLEDHDANYGITWATLDNWCESFNLKKTKQNELHKLQQERKRIYKIQ